VTTEELREKAYKKLGWLCECCQESESLFLQIGHRNNDGYISRGLRGRSAGHVLYRQVLKMDNPKSVFRLECANCNQGARRNGGVCPHESKSSPDKDQEDKLGKC